MIDIPPKSGGMNSISQFLLMAVLNSTIKVHLCSFYCETMFRDTPKFSYFQSILMKLSGNHALLVAFHTVYQ